MAIERVQMSWIREAYEYAEDVAVCTLHFRNLTNSALSPAERQQVGTALTSAWNSYKAIVSPSYKLHEFRWYDQQVWPTLSPLLEVHPAGDIPGTSADSAMPPQCATSVTLEVSARSRWGRFYLPAPGVGQLVALNGRLTTTCVDTTEQSYFTALQGLAASNIHPVVWSPKGGKGPPAFAAGSYLDVTAIRMDDIVDVIRSRRWQDAPYIKRDFIA